MANVLNVTTPVTGQENVTRARPQHPSEQTNIQQITDPSRVPKSQDKNVYSERQPNQFSPNLDSNFDKFMRAVRNTPGLTETQGQLLFSKMGNLVNSGINTGFAQEIEKYMEMLKMSDADLLAMLKGQQGANLKFSGPFFDLLRQLVNSSETTNELKISVLDFLRKYDSLTSSSHILKNIIANLRNIAAGIPQSSSSQLAGMIEKLSLEEMVGNNPKNLTLLKTEIIPFLSQYIGATKDLGAVRDLIAMLTLNIARYEAGSRETFMQALRDVTSYSQMGSHLQGISVDELAARLTAGLNQGNSLVDQFISIIARGMNGEAGFQNKAFFQNMVQSILINESVYMPVLHYTLPANVNGGLFFSELWVDPNANNSQEGDPERAVKLLVKFDIKDVGFFETIILAQNKNVDMELYYPEKYASREIEIKDALASIMTKNNLNFRSLFMAKVEVPKSVSEVFPKIYERKNAINVTI